MKTTLSEVMSEIIVSERESLFISDEICCSAIVSERERMENRKSENREKERGIAIEKKRVNEILE